MTRFTFLDGLRGIALILMVINHTSRWWMDTSMGWGRYWLVYGSMVWPAPIFLFLVGFCLPLSHRADTGGPLGLAVRSARRAIPIIGTGFLLNVLVFPEDPWWSGGVLQTIGLSIVLLGPTLPFLDRRAVRYGLLALAVGAYVAFAGAYPALVGWVSRHPVTAQILFLDFPPWPWVSGAVVGLVLGRVWLDARSAGREARYFRTAAITGVACVLGWFAWDWWFGTMPRFGFARDLVLNRHWTPAGGTNLLVVGGGALLLAVTWWAMQVRRLRLRWLVVLGRSAFMLYFLHQLIVLTLVNRALGLRFNDWLFYSVANLGLMVVLVCLGGAWLWLESLTRRERPEASTDLTIIPPRP